MFRLAAALLVTGVALSASQHRADDNVFPRTRFLGRATVQYKDERVRAVAIYDYSQRNHDQAWLLVQFGFALNEPAVVRRESIYLITPGGGNVPLATQQQFLAADTAQILQLRQNVGIFRRHIENYFPTTLGSNRMQWVALPGELVRDPLIIPTRDNIATGDLYFKSPTMRWEAGTHRLVFDHEKGHAELQIRLE
jgi:hypothetical protein